MRAARGAFSFVILATCTELACFGDNRPPLPTIAGPEAEDLRAATRGYVVTEHRATADGFLSEIALTEVASLAERVIRPVREGPYVMASQVSGPDARGRVAYVQSSGGGDSARLNTIDADGANNRVIASTVGPRYQAFGSHPALAPDGGAIAFMNNFQYSTYDGEYAASGTLAVWRPETNRATAIATDVDDGGGVAWFPDGERLAYVSRVPRQTLDEKAIDQLTRGAPGCRQNAMGREFVPLVYVIDVKSGVRHPLHVGSNPVVSTDGSAILLECESAILMDTAGQLPRPVTLPGDLGRPLALLDGRLVVYWGLPTQGTPIVRSPYGSFRAGTQAVTIKVTDVATGRFQTIIKAIDPRWDASFGRPKEVLGARTNATSSF